MLTSTLGVGVLCSGRRVACDLVTRHLSLVTSVKLRSTKFRSTFESAKICSRSAVSQFCSAVSLNSCYWDTKHCTAVARVKMLIGAAIGKTLDDSIEGTRRV